MLEPLVVKATREIPRRERRSNSPNLSGVVLCKTKEDTLDVPNLLNDYLYGCGLVLSKNKTKITHLKDGFDFLGINFRSFNTTGVL